MGFCWYQFTWMSFRQKKNHSQDFVPPSYLIQKRISTERAYWTWSGIDRIVYESKAWWKLWSNRWIRKTISNSFCFLETSETTSLFSVRWKLRAKKGRKFISFLKVKTMLNESQEGELWKQFASCFWAANLINIQESMLFNAVPLGVHSSRRAFFLPFCRW